MSNPIAEAFVTVRPDTKNFSNDVESGIGGSFKKVAAVAAGAFAAIGVKNLLGDALAEARESIKVGKLTDQVIQSTGGAAHVTAKQVGDLANSLSLKAGVDDEVIQSGANLLLTFKNVRNEVGKGNDVFNQANKAALDLSAAGFGDLHGTSILVGKALNDPIKGITALGRAGVTFSEDQKKAIKAMVETGDTLGAQKIILAEVNSQVGGAAAAAADPMQKFGVLIGNLKESIGLALIPALNWLIETVGTALPKVFEFAGKIVDAFMGGFDNPDAVNNVKGFQGFLIGFGQIVSKIFRSLKILWDGAQDGIAGFGVAVGKVFGQSEDSPFVDNLIKTLETLWDIIKAVSSFIADNWKPILIGLVAVFFPITSAIAALVAGVIFAYTHFKFFRDAIAFVVTTFQSLFAFVVSIWPQIQEAITHVINTIAIVIRTVIGGIQIFWHQFGDDIMTYIGGVFQVIQAAIETAMNVIAGIIRFVLAIINGDWGKAWDALKGIVHSVVEGIGKALGGIAGMIRGVIGAVAGAAMDLGKSILDGIGKGLSAAAGFVMDVAKSLANALIGIVNTKIIDNINNALEFRIEVFGKGVDINPPDIPHIPKMHTGGIVAGPWGQEVPIIARAGERIIPLGARGDGGGGGPTYILQADFKDTTLNDDVAMRMFRSMEALHG